MSLVQIPTTYINLGCLTSMFFIIVMLSFMSGKQKTDVAYTYSSKSHMHFRLIALCIFCLDWDQLGGPYGLFWGFSGFKQAGSLSFPLQPLCVPSSICFLQVLGSNVWFSTWWWLDISRCDNSIPVLLLLIMTNCQPLSLFLVFPGQPISFAKAWKICHNTGQIKKLQHSVQISDLLLDHQLFL